MFGLRVAILGAGAMVAVAVLAAAMMVSLEEVCSRNPDKEQARFNRLVYERAPFDEIMAAQAEPIYDCEWRWR